MKLCPAKGLIPQIGDCSEAHPHGGFIPKRLQRGCICRGESFATPHSTFLIMTTINTDFSTELLDQELPMKDLSDFSGGRRDPKRVTSQSPETQKGVAMALGQLIEFFWESGRRGAELKYQNDPHRRLWED